MNVTKQAAKSLVERARDKLETTRSTQVRQHQTLAMKESCNKKCLQKYFAALWLQQTSCYSSKNNYQNTQRIHPKVALDQVDKSGKLRANSDG